MTLENDAGPRRSILQPVNRPLPPAFPPPPPPLGGEIKPAAGGRKWQIKEDPALWKQQGGDYPYYSSFTLTLAQLGIKDYNRIPGPDEFLKTWKFNGAKTVPPARDIDQQKMAEVIATLKRMKEEWPTYKKAQVHEVFRGDSALVIDAYPWLKGFSQRAGSLAQGYTEGLGIEIESPLVMSTAKCPGMSYVKGKTVLWHFQLDRGHQGVSEGLYAAEGEVTFALYNRIRIDTLEYLPPGMSYQDNTVRFGDAHRYVIRATMLSA